MAGLEDVDLEMADMVEQTDSELKPMLETHSPVHKRRKQRVQRSAFLYCNAMKSIIISTRPNFILRLLIFCKLPATSHLIMSIIQWSGNPFLL